MFNLSKLTNKIDAKWRTPVLLAVLLHIIIIFIAIIYPFFSKETPEPEKYTVNLVNISEPIPETTPELTEEIPPILPKTQAPTSPTNPEEVQPPPPAKISAPILEPAPKPIVSLKPKAKQNTISLKARKKKKKLRKPKRNKKLRNKEKRQSNELKKQRRLLAEAIRKEEEARQKEAEAVEAEKRVLSEITDYKRISNKTAINRKKSINIPKNKRTSSNKKSKINKNATTRNYHQYHADIFNRLQQFWSLPNIKEWDRSINAVIVLTIAKDGRIIDKIFKRKSGDKLFDQNVIRTIDDASPLPAIPKSMNKNIYKIGLRFKPGRIE